MHASNLTNFDVGNIDVGIFSTRNIGAGGFGRVHGSHNDVFFFCSLTFFNTSFDICWYFIVSKMESLCMHYINS